MSRYTVVEHQEDQNGHLVTFSRRKRSLLDWILRRPGQQVTFQARSDFGIVWHSFPDMHEVELGTAFALRAAFERHKLLGRHSDG